MHVVLRLAWIVLKMLITLSVSVAAFAAVMTIGLDRYFLIITLATLLAVGIIFVSEVGVRQTLLVVAASPALMIRLFPLLMVAVVFVPICLFALAILTPLLLFQFAMYYAMQ